MSSLTAQTRAFHGAFIAPAAETHASELTLRTTVALVLLAFVIAVIGVVAWQPAVIITAGLMTALTVPFLVATFLASLSTK
ncbi:MAG: hypothetical protein ACTJGR_07430 [Pauljensenia sp.]